MLACRWLRICWVILVATCQSANMPNATGQEAKGKSASAAQDKSAGSAAESAIPANLVGKLRERVGDKVTVSGHIERTSRSNGGHHFLNFNSSELTIVCLKEHVGKFKDRPPADAFKDRDVIVTGTLELHKGKLQILLEDPAQIRIVKPESPSPPREVKLKQIRPDVWLSPAGLRYAGRDPAGLTRVEHIGRHLKDQPNRDGPHGVFDGGEGVAFAVIDEAWGLAISKKLVATREGDRSLYLVPMGRRIGYLGGRDGKQRNHPQLQRVQIVFETGTKNIITAFPK